MKCTSQPAGSTSLIYDAATCGKTDSLHAFLVNFKHGVNS